MHERPLTWSEVCAQFPDEWVVLVDTTWSESALATARVYTHCKRRREVSSALDRACGEFTNVGCFFTGRVLGIP
jgi:hypothetical protein